MNTPDTADPQRHPPTPYKFSAEDQRILQECNRESFYQRSLPCAFGFAGLTFMAVKAGYLKPHLTWGPAPKVVAAVFLGYFVGKLSYQTICAEKLMANPNSELGAALRARRRQGGGGFQDSLTLDLPGFKESSASVFSDSTAPNTFTDLNTDRPYQDLDDTYQPGFDSPQRQDDFILPPQAPTPNSYEEMRRKNREDFENKTRAFRTQAEADRNFPPPRTPTPTDYNPEPVERYKATNIYGDIFDK